MRASWLGITLIFLLSAAALPLCAEEEPPQLWSILWRVQHSDLVAAGRVVAERPTNTYSLRGTTHYRDVVVDLSVDTVFFGQLQGDSLSLVIKRIAPDPKRSGPWGYLYAGPPLAEYSVGRRYLVFLRRELPEVFVPLDPVQMTEIALSENGSARSLPAEADDSARRQAIAEELMQRLRAITSGEIEYNTMGLLVELLNQDAEPLLRELLRHSQPWLRINAAEWLHQLGLPVPPETLLAVVANPDESHWARAGAARVLGTLQASEARPLFQHLALTAQESNVQEAALYGLRELDDPGDPRPLLPLLDHPDENIRYMAAGVFLKAATGTIISVDAHRAHESEVITALKGWAAGGPTPDLTRYLQ